jgi:hypothetical protein
MGRRHDQEVSDGREHARLAPPERTPLDVAAWQSPFRFTDADRRSLTRVLGVMVIDVQAVVSFLEITAGAYLTVRPEPGQMGRDLRTLRHLTHDLLDRLSSLDHDVTDAMLDAGLVRGYDPHFIGDLRERLQRFEVVMEQAVADVPPAPGPGRPPELIRGWLARQIRMTLEDEGGIDVKSRKGARALGDCLRIILKSVGESVPSDTRPLLNEARRP